MRLKASRRQDFAVTLPIRFVSFSFLRFVLFCPVRSNLCRVGPFCAIPFLSVAFAVVAIGANLVNKRFQVCTARLRGPPTFTIIQTYLNSLTCV